ncbi:glutathione S-transferase 1-like isoform X4 [Diorhabda sublineata]|uniref:glutathione S-transferase 1-like isoform X4 n=1 Tax=Diorhabda sublineata TaxID=1163346 RepID=UPI0024E17D8F|nr:glutathione S-transferase 1-like isoform X4 [Diorhabda sublineata]
MVPKLFASNVSPAVRSTLMTIKALGIDVEIIPVNMSIGEHLRPDYLKMNPMHTVPTLKDDECVIYDSHAINIYLIEKYQQNTDLYPRDAAKRAIVHQRLFLEAGIIFPRNADIVRSILKEGAKTVNKEKAAKVIEGYNFLETILETSEYAAGDKMTIADFSLVATVTSANVLVPIAANRYPKISEWITKMEQLPYYKEANAKTKKTTTPIHKRRQQLHWFVYRHD